MSLNNRNPEAELFSAKNNIQINVVDASKEDSFRGFGREIATVKGTDGTVFSVQQYGLTFEVRPLNRTGKIYSEFNLNDLIKNAVGSLVNVEDSQK